MDVNNIIETILRKINLKADDCSSEKEYKDEPILRTAADMIKFTPPKYREMRKLAMYNFDSEEAKTFYEQGKFMEDFEDDYDFTGEFSRYYPTYKVMNDHQLRGYFSWRTKTRKGEVKQTSLSFVFVYIYELINNIGVKTPEEGFFTLKNFWQAYREIEPKIDGYMKSWLKDYIVYYNLDKKFLDEISDNGNAISVLQNFKTHSADEVFKALNSFSSYDFENSKFFKKYPEDVKTVVYNVFSQLYEHYEKNSKNGLFEKYFGKPMSGSYSFFKSAVFYDRIKTGNFIYEVNEAEKYICRNGNWSREYFLYYSENNSKIGDLLKEIDYIMRQKYAYKSTLKEPKTTKIIQDIIIKETENYLLYKKISSAPKIEIDVSKLDKIRKTSLETQNKLIVEEDGVMPPEEPEAVLPPQNQDTLGLSETEYCFIKCLLYNEPYNDLLRSKGIMVSVITDCVNEKLFEMFNDTVIVYDGDLPVVLEDYEDELKGKIKK